MFVWPKEVIFGGSENFTILPKIRVGGGGYSKILSTNLSDVSIAKCWYENNTNQPKVLCLQLNPRFGQKYLQIKTASKVMYK